MAVGGNAQPIQMNEQKCKYKKILNIEHKFATLCY